MVFGNMLEYHRIHEISLVQNLSSAKLMPTIPQEIEKETRKVLVCEKFECRLVQ